MAWQHRLSNADTMQVVKVISLKLSKVVIMLLLLLPLSKDIIKLRLNIPLRFGAQDLAVPTQNQEI